MRVVTFVSGLLQWRYHQQVVPELDLYGVFPAVVLKIFGDFIVSGDGHKLCFKRLAEYPCMFRTVNAREGATAQWSIHMNVAGRKHFGTGLNRRKDDQVALGRVNLLAGTDRLVDDFRGRWLTWILDSGGSRIFGRFSGGGFRGRCSIDFAVALVATGK